MKRGKDGEKIMEPMFPRLHVKDAEKGGPRAPPRNKMALYEQLSIPSHRFSHVVLPCSSNSTAANSVPMMSQSGGNNRSMLASGLLPTGHRSEQQYSQYSDLSSTPLAQVEKRKKLDDDDYRVPVFDHSMSNQEFDKCSNDINQENVSSSNTRCFAHSKMAKETGMRQEGKRQKENNSQEFVAGWANSISYSSSIGKPEGPKKRNVSLVSHEPGDKPENCIGRSKTGDSLQTELCVDSQPINDGHIIDKENMAAVARRNSPNSRKDLPLEDHGVTHDFSNDSESNELERGDSVSETSILDTMSTVDITPDDVVGIIGQKHFWKARRAIANQQRVFAVQVFELHRLVEVQKLIAASPHLLLDDSAYLGEPIKVLSGKKTPIKVIPNPSKQKDDLEKTKDKEGSAKITVGKASVSSAQNMVPPTNGRPASGNTQEPSLISGDHNPNPWCYNQPQGHQWLVPVMSPSEGLIYKPYPGLGFMSQASGGCGTPGSVPMMGNVFPPAYGIPAAPAHYQLASFAPVVPHGYFPPYSMPNMNAAGFSGSSIEDTRSQKNGTVADTVNSHVSEDIEVQASSTSSPSAVEGKNMLPLFPTSPAKGGRTGVIRVVPHNAVSASESAARIFRAIQEGRKQYD